MTNKFSFVVGGTLSPDHPTYVKRQADTQLLEACLRHEYAYVLTTRQVGKSSLMVSTAKILQERGISVVQIDLSGSFGGNATMEEWYFTFVDDVIEQLQLQETDEIEQWWANQHPLPTLKRFERFWRDLVLPNRSEVIVFIDEIDYMLNYEFKNDFFAELRFLYNQRKTVPIYKQLTFVLLGTARPETLSDAKNTPFNIGEWIVVEDLQLEHCEPFWLALDEKHPHQGRGLFEEIYNWTAGHPYLTQKLSQAVFENPTVTTTMLVESLVDQLFVHSRVTDRNLNYVQDQIINHPTLSQEMLYEYNELLKHESIPDKGTPASNYLQLYGLIKKDDNKLWVRNNIYKTVFNQGWVADHLRQREQERYVELQHQLQEKEAELEQLQEQIVSYEGRVMTLTKNKTEIEHQLTKTKEKLQLLQQKSRIQVIKHKNRLLETNSFFMLSIAASIVLALIVRFGSIELMLVGTALMIIAFIFAFIRIIRPVTLLNLSSQQTDTPSSPTSAERVSLDS